MSAIGPYDGRKARRKRCNACVKRKIKVSADVTKGVNPINGISVMEAYPVTTARNPSSRASRLSSPRFSGQCLLVEVLRAGLGVSASMT